MALTEGATLEAIEHVIFVWLAHEVDGKGENHDEQSRGTLGNDPDAGDDGHDEGDEDFTKHNPHLQPVVLFLIAIVKESV